MTDFYDKAISLRRECMATIESILKTMENEQCSLLDPALDPEEDDIYFDLPTAVHFGRYDYGINFYITSVRLEDGEIWFNGVSSSDHGDEYSFGTGEVEIHSLADVADLLQEIKKEQDERI